LLYLFDRAIVDNLKASLTDEANKNVFLTTAENYPGILAQMQDDTIGYPLILLHREDDMPIDTGLYNFTRARFGVPCVFDNDRNNVYYERAVPVNLQYTLRILSTNVADRDELARELFYKYMSMFFLTIQLPYESDRKIRFGIEVDRDYGLTNESSAAEYTQTGALYQSTMKLITRGCVYLTYTPRHVKRPVMSSDIKTEDPAPNSSDVT